MTESSQTWADLAERARSGLERLPRLSAVVSLVDDDQCSVHRVRYEAGAWRIEDERGLLVLCAEGRIYRRAGRRGPRFETVGPGWVPGPELGYLGWGHAELFRDPPAEPTGDEPVAGSVAGRDVLTVRLLSAGRPLDVGFDVATGLPLRVAAVGTPYLTEVSSFEVPGSLPEGSFAFPSAAPSPRRHADGGAVAAAALAERGLRLPEVIPGLGDVADWSIIDADEETESFVAVGRSVSEGIVALARTALSHPPSRPLVAASGVSIGARLPRHVYAWHDATWSYELLTDAELDQGALTLMEY